MGDILFLAHRVPFPPNRGDKIRSANLLTKLAAIAPVHVGCFAESDEDRDGAATLDTLAARIPQPAIGAMGARDCGGMQHRNHCHLLRSDGAIHPR